MTIQPCLDSPQYRDFIVEEENVATAREMGQPSWVLGLCAREANKPSHVVFKVTVPGDLRHLRWGGRFRDDNAGVRLYYSFDGKSWMEKPWSYLQGPKTTHNERRRWLADYETLGSFPEATREVWLKFSFRSFGPGGEKSRLQLTPGVRIDAGYVPAGHGKKPPVEITYCWTEHHCDRDIEKTHVRKITSFPTTYPINVAGDREPTMRSVSIQLPAVAKE